jgi:hypothetical protein
LPGARHADAPRRPSDVQRSGVDALLRVEKEIPFAIEVDALPGHVLCLLSLWFSMRAKQAV